jgi:hypothetical protein
LHGFTIHFLPCCLDHKEVFQGYQRFSGGRTYRLFPVDKGDTVAYVLAIMVIPRELNCPMSSSLLTVEEVADLLKISPRAVYQYRQRLGGFYPFGIRVPPFRREEI